MTYDNLEVFLGPNLNMVLGPNGTGKSAIVCSIIIGLAGEVTLTGRGNSAVDFVKKKTDHCSTLIELFNKSGNNFIVQRKITITTSTNSKATDHKSEWKLNGRTVKKSDIQDFARKFNIKVDNLCQFLPQDSVASFVKMNPSELLHNTLKAVGDSSLVDDQQVLIEISKKIIEIEKRLNVIKDDCAVNEVNAERLEGEVKKLNERKALVKKKKIVEQKIHYVRYKVTEALKTQAKNKLADLKKELKELENHNEPVKQAEEMYKTKLKGLQSTVMKLEGNCNSFKQLAGQKFNEVESTKIACQSDFAAFSCMEQEELSRESKIKLLQNEVEGIECRLDEVRNTDCSRQIKTVTDQIDAQKDKIRQLGNNKEELSRDAQQKLIALDQLKQEAASIKAVQERKLRLMQQNFPKVHLVHEWLLKNKELFTRNIYSPMMCEINIKDIKYAKVVENAISRNDLCAFVCEDGEDLKKFTRLVREKFATSINVILSIPDSSISDSGLNGSLSSSFSQGYADSLRSQNREPPNCNSLKQYGVVAYLKDLIEAPKPIVQYLCKSLNFHKIPYAENTTEDKLKYLLDHFPQVYSGNDFYTTGVSRYDKKKFTTTDKIRDANLLRFWFDKKRYDEVDAKYKELFAEREVLDQEIKLVEKKLDDEKSEWQKLQDLLHELKLKQNEKETLLKKLKFKQELIERITNCRIDLQAERRKLQEKIQTNNIKCINLLKHLSKIFADNQQAKEALNETKLMIKITEVNCKISRKNLEDSQKSCERLNEEIRKHTEEYKKSELGLKALSKVTMDLIDGFSANGKLDDNVAAEFNKIEGDTVDSLERYNGELDFQISRIFYDKNNVVIDQFEKQQRELKEKKKEIEAMSKDLKRDSDKRDEIKERWLPTLKSVIETIDKGYDQFMKRLSYGGRVLLDFDDKNPENFSLYGVKIMVKYRDDEELIPLSSTRQSGGERSVATMIYMLALQTKTSAPFRCVDEINQGMDQENERKVFELLVETADRSSSQYFLISPKLLADLPYSPKMKIHIVFNGGHITREAFKALTNKPVQVN